MRHPFLLIPWFACTAFHASEPAVTVYNGGFAVVRDHVAIELPAGIGTIRYPGASAHVEAGTALIAVPTGVTVLDHTYRNDPVSTARLLQLFEGKVIDIEMPANSKNEIRKAKIIRAPISIHQEAWQRFGNAYAQRQQALLYGSGGQQVNEPLLEIDGQLRFGMPGTPLFPALPPGTDLRPTLEWQVRSATAIKADAELSYLCAGMRWEAAYTLVAGTGDEDHVDLNGVITVDNQSGTDFRTARLKFVAGEVSKLDDENSNGFMRKEMAYSCADSVGYSSTAARAEGKAFSDYHIYTMPDPVDMRDRETKQLGFLDARGVTSSKRLIYDGLVIDGNRYQGWNQETIRSQAEFGTAWNPKVSIERVITNTESNHLGKPLPEGIVRCYLKDSDGRPEFIGENRIDHIPEGEPLRIRTGNAFDVVGERVQTAFSCDSSRRICDESFRIVLRNHRATPADITVVEHLYRWVNWDIRTPSTPFTKRDSRTIEMPVTVPAQGEITVTYQAHYSW